MMDSIEQTFSDKEGNHLLVALCFCDDEYKINSLNIPEEYSDVNIVDISITKADVSRPIHYSVFFRMSGWLLEEFRKNQNSIFTFICSTDDLETNHPDIPPQQFRWNLFDRLYRRMKDMQDVYIQDVIVGPEGYQSMARAFYRSRHIPLINLITAFLNEKQQLYEE